MLEPEADGFRNYQRPDDKAPAERRLLDRANMLKLTAPEMTVLVGGMRVLGTNARRARKHGVFTDRVGQLTNDWFVNLLDASSSGQTVRRARRGRRTSAAARSGRPPPPTSCSASHSQLRAIAEVYAGDDAKEKFVRDFVRRLGQGDGPRPLPEAVAATAARSGRRC